jgi:hypothetical protein
MASRRRGVPAGFNIMTIFTPGRCLGRNQASGSAKFLETKAAFRRQLAAMRLGRESIRMSTRRIIAMLSLSAVSPVSVPRTAKTMPRGSPPNPHCCAKQPVTGPLNARRLAKHSATFRRAAKEAWRATQNGHAPFEAGFSSNTAALGTLHVHDKWENRYSAPEISRQPECFTRRSLWNRARDCIRLTLMETSLICSTKRIGSARGP